MTLMASGIVSGLNVVALRALGLKAHGEGWGSGLRGLNARSKA